MEHWKATLAILVMAATLAWTGCKVEDGAQPVQAATQGPAKPDYHIPNGLDEGDLPGGIHFYRFHDDDSNGITVNHIVCFRGSGNYPTLSCVAD